MNTSKATWLKHPRPIVTTLHSFLYEGTESLFVMFTLGEEGEMKLVAISEKEAISEFIFLHTPNDYLVFNKSGISGKLFTVDIDIKKDIDSSIILKKNKERLTFISDDKELISIANPAFLGSASFGVRAKGNGKTYIEIF